MTRQENKLKHTIRTAMYEFLSRTLRENKKISECLLFKQKYHIKKNLHCAFIHITTLTRRLSPATINPNIRMYFSFCDPIEKQTKNFTKDPSNKKNN